MDRNYVYTGMLGPGFHYGAVHKSGQKQEQKQKHHPSRAIIISTIR